MRFILLTLLLVTSLNAETIKVGILHSLTGTMASSEKPVVDATLFAIQELNDAGGLLGKKIEPIVIDGASNSEEFAKGAKKLILEENVSVVFGCWTSASRKAVKPIFEEHDNLLFYPVQYEGLEDSPNIIYTGAAPNQQIIPATKWCADHLGTRFFLVGSDYIFPREANAIIKKVIGAAEAEVVGEAYIPLGSRQVSEVIEQIVQAKPTVILNTINGDTNHFFFKELREKGITPDHIPTMSFSIGMNEVDAFDLFPASVGDYTCWNYYQSIKSPENKVFVRDFLKVYGADKKIEDPMEAAYIGVHLWAQAVNKAKSISSQDVQHSVKGQVYLAPEGIVIVDKANNHLWKTVRIARLSPYEKFNIVWSSKRPVKPNPYPFAVGGL